MSNPERDPDEVTCASADAADVEVMVPREVPLGGLRAMTVRRTLPQRQRSLIGAWCFVDHYGPDDVADTGGMQVAPHPHTGLQTVSWLFTGEVEHRDSAGHHAVVRPGELNVMTAGRGISHSEVSTPQTATLHGVQLWVALPEAHRGTDPGFDHVVPEPVGGPGWVARVFFGSLLGSTSPAPSFSPLLGAELLLDPGCALELDVDPGFEHGVLVDTGVLRVGPTDTAAHELAYVPTGRDRLLLVAGDAPVRALLLGGPPFGEAIVIPPHDVPVLPRSAPPAEDAAGTPGWWNFVGRSHDEIVAFREQWQHQLDDGVLREGAFGVPVDDAQPPIPAPALPQVRLRERR